MEAAFRRRLAVGPSGAPEEVEEAPSGGALRDKDGVELYLREEQRFFRPERIYWEDGPHTYARIGVLCVARPVFTLYSSPFLRSGRSPSACAEQVAAQVVYDRSFYDRIRRAYAGRAGFSLVGARQRVEYLCFDITLSGPDFPECLSGSSPMIIASLTLVDGKISVRGHDPCFSDFSFVPCIGAGGGGSREGQAQALSIEPYLTSPSVRYTNRDYGGDFISSEVPNLTAPNASYILQIPRGLSEHPTFSSGSGAVGAIPVPRDTRLGVPVVEGRDGTDPLPEIEVGGAEAEAQDEVYWESLDGIITTGSRLYAGGMLAGRAELSSDESRSVETSQYRSFAVLDLEEHEDYSGWIPVRITPQFADRHGIRIRAGEYRTPFGLFVQSRRPGLCFVHPHFAYAREPELPAANIPAWDDVELVSGTLLSDDLRRWVGQVVPMDAGAPEPVRNGDWVRVRLIHAFIEEQGLSQDAQARAWTPCGPIHCANGIYYAHRGLGRDE